MGTKLSQEETAPIATVERTEQSVGGVDKLNPRTWPLPLKLWIFFGAFTTYWVVSGVNSMYVASIPGVKAEFNVSETAAILPLTLYALGVMFGPIVTAAFSEEFGRQYVYKLSLLLSAIFTVVAGSAKTFGTLLAGRLLAGVTGSPSVTASFGTLNDIFDVEDTLASTLLVLYAMCAVASTETGPPIGESVVRDRGWRWNFWVMTMLVGACFLIVVFNPETYAKELKRRAANEPRGSLWQSFKTATTRPIHMLCVEPIILPTAAVVTMGQVMIYIFYAAYPYMLQQVYSFSNYHVGLAFLPLLVGTLLAVPILSVFHKRKFLVARAKAKEKGESVAPEERLYGAMVGGILMPVGLFWLAWTARPSIHWACPLLSGIPYGCGFALTQIIYPVYKNDIYRAEFGASALAVDNGMRFLFSSVFPLFTIQMIDRMTFKWTMTMLALILTAMIPIPWFFFKYGKHLRARSRYVRLIQEAHAQRENESENREFEDLSSRPSTFNSLTPERG